MRKDTNPSQFLASSHPEPEDDAVRHVTKKRRVDKSLEVVFDDKKRQEYLSGFRKRKHQRRQVAKQQNTRRSQQEKIEERSERRSKLKAELGLPDDYGITLQQKRPSHSEPKDEVVSVYRSGPTTTIVTTESLVEADTLPHRAAGKGAERTGRIAKPGQAKSLKGIGKKGKARGGKTK
jgi:ribosomal RNA-processing protein 17